MNKCQKCGFSCISDKIFFLHNCEQVIAEREHHIITNLENIEYQELKTIAKENNINTHRMPKDEIIKAIREVKEGQKEGEK